MELLLDYTNIRGLFRIISNIPDECTKIRAAIAFNKDPLLINEAIKKGIRLDWWGLFDHTEATSYDLVTKALKHKDLVRFFPIPMNFHAKIIHFDSYGLYIGSGNMTAKALFSNTEAGVFFSQDDIEDQNLEESIDDFFLYLSRNSMQFAEDDLSKWKMFLDSHAIMGHDREEDVQAKIDFSDIFGYLPEFHPLENQIGQKKKKSLTEISSQEILIAQTDFAKYENDIAQRSRQQQAFVEIADTLSGLFSRCAAGEIGNDAFYEEMWDVWATHASRFQGRGFERTGKSANWREACQSLVRILKLRGEKKTDLIDDCVAAEMDLLKGNGNPVRKAWFTEMLCHYYPDLYPLLDRPVFEWLKNHEYRLYQNLLDGTKYIELSRALRILVANNKSVIANLAELDIVLRYDSGI